MNKDSRVIYKYPFKEADIRQGIDHLAIPKGKVVLVAQQDGNPLPTVWVEHSLTPLGGDSFDRYRIAGTGHEIGPEFLGWEHVGSCICNGLVWHVYREGN